MKMFLDPGHRSMAVQVMIALDKNGPVREKNVLLRGSNSVARVQPCQG